MLIILLTGRHACTYDNVRTQECNDSERESWVSNWAQVTPNGGKGFLNRRNVRFGKLKERDAKFELTELAVTPKEFPASSACTS